MDELTRAHGRLLKENFSDLVGKREGDPEFDEIVASQRRIDLRKQYARLFAQLRRAGTPIPDNDLWIAALVLENDLVLASRDGHFGKVTQLLRG